MVVQSTPSDPSRSGEYNDWYENTHVPEILSIPGFITAKRYKSADGSYLAIYELDDLGAVSTLRARRTTMSEALCLDPPPVVSVYELLE